MKSVPAARPSRLLPTVLVLALAGGALASARAQSAGLPPELAPFITTATRTPASPGTLGSAVDAITAADLARRQISGLAGALDGVPGAPLFASGGAGAAASLFLRGANSNQTLFLVDGIRLNDPNTDYNVFLGGACVASCDSLEIAHGPQSTLYGGEAIGGVVSLRAQPGAGPSSGRVALEAGSFGTRQGAVAAQGASGADAYTFSAQGGHTDNARANNAFDSANLTLRLDHRVNARLAAGGTLRWFHGVYGDPGDRFTNDPDNQDREENVLATAFADLAVAGGWSGHAVLGAQDRRFVSVNPRAGGPTQVTVVTNRRAVLDAQASWAAGTRQRLTAGLTAEANHTRNTGFGAIDRRQGLLAAFAEDQYSPADTVFLTAGLRSDDFDTFGRATTGRATAAWLAVPGVLKFRASYGTAFRSPSFLDLYGRSAFYTGNPDLRPERARGADAGADWYLPGRRGTVSLTGFRTDFTDLIASSPDFRSEVNVQRARTAGVEFSAEAALPGAWRIRGAYTYLEADNLTAGSRLLRRPRHAFNADLWHDFGRGVSAGAGLAFAAGREDVDARTFRTVDGEDYTVVRLYGAWQATPRLALKLRGENLLGEKYEEVNGYPALGFGAFGGAEWRW